MQTIATDALIIGAGPVGLFQVFELGLLGLHAEVVDALPRAGGQCAELYADKPIYDIPGLPRCTGGELVERLLQQIAPFKAGFHFGQLVQQLQPQAGGRFMVETSAGTRFDAGCVVIAAGVGAFQPRRLKVDGLAEFEGRQVLYRVDSPLPMAGRQVIVVGAGDAALTWALQAAADEAAAARVTLLHRRDSFVASPALIEALNVQRGLGRIHFIAGQITRCAASDGRLTSVHIAASNGTEADTPVDLVLADLGLVPQLGPIAQWGLALERKQLPVDTEKFQTAVPGLFAVGDINTYAGKKKLILCGFHEATLAAFAAASHLWPERRPALEYTTSSPRLQALLGVAP